MYVCITNICTYHIQGKLSIKGAKFKFWMCREQMYIAVVHKYWKEARGKIWWRFPPTPNLIKSHTEERLCYGHLGSLNSCPYYRGCLISRSFNTLQHYIGTQHSVLIIEVFLIQRFVIERFHSYIIYKYWDCTWALFREIHRCFP